MASWPRPLVNPWTGLWEWPWAFRHWDAQPTEPEAEPESPAGASASSSADSTHGAAPPINEGCHADWPAFESCDIYYAVWQVDGAPEWRGVVWGPQSWEFLCSLLPGNLYARNRCKLRRCRTISDAIRIYKKYALQYNAPLEPRPRYLRHLSSCPDCNQGILEH